MPAPLGVPTDPVAFQPSNLPVAERAHTIDAQVRAYVRSLCADAYERSPEEGALTARAVTFSLSRHVFARDLTQALPPELNLQVLSSLSTGDVARFARVNKRAARLAHTAMGDGVRNADHWARAPVTARRVFVGSSAGFVTPCDAGPEPSPRATDLWAALRAGRVELWSSEGALQCRQSVTAPSATAFSWSTDGQDLLWLAPAGEGLQVWRAPSIDLAQATVWATLPNLGAANAIIPHPRVPELYALGVGANVLLCRGACVLQTLAGIRGQDTYGEAGRCVWHVNGAWLAVVGHTRVSVCAFASDALQPPRMLNTPVSTWHHVAWHPTRPLLAVPGRNGIALWDVQGGDPKVVANTFTPPAVSHQTVPTFSPDGRVLVVRCDSGWLWVYTQRHGDRWVQERQIQNHTASGATRVVFSSVDASRLLLIQHRRLWVGTLRRN